MLRSAFIGALLFVSVATAGSLFFAEHASAVDGKDKICIKGGTADECCFSTGDIGAAAGLNLSAPTNPYGVIQPGGNLDRARGYCHEVFGSGQVGCSTINTNYGGVICYQGRCWPGPQRPSDVGISINGSTQEEQVFNQGDNVHLVWTGGSSHDSLRLTCLDLVTDKNFCDVTYTAQQARQSFTWEQIVKHSSLFVVVGDTSGAICGNANGTSIRSISVEAKKGVSFVRILTEGLENGLERYNKKIWDIKNVLPENMGFLGDFFSAIPFLSTLSAPSWSTITADFGLIAELSGCSAITVMSVALPCSVVISLVQTAMMMTTGVIDNFMRKGDTINNTAIEDDIRQILGNGKAGFFASMTSGIVGQLIKKFFGNNHCMNVFLAPMLNGIQDALLNMLRELSRKIDALPEDYSIKYKSPENCGVQWSDSCQGVCCDYVEHTTASFPVREPVKSLAQTAGPGYVDPDDQTGLMTGMLLGGSVGSLGGDLISNAIFGSSWIAKALQGAGTIVATTAFSIFPFCPQSERTIASTTPKSCPDGSAPPCPSLKPTNKCPGGSDPPCPPDPNPPDQGPTPTVAPIPPVKEGGGIVYPLIGFDPSTPTHQFFDSLMVVEAINLPEYYGLDPSMIWSDTEYKNNSKFQRSQVRALSHYFTDSQRSEFIAAHKRYGASTTGWPPTVRDRLGGFLGEAKSKAGLKNNPPLLYSKKIK